MKTKLENPTTKLTIEFESSKELNKFYLLFRHTAIQDIVGATYALAIREKLREQYNASPEEETLFNARLMDMLKFHSRDPSYKAPMKWEDIDIYKEE